LAHISGHEINDISFGTHPQQIVHFPVSFGGLGFQDFSVQAVSFHQQQTQKLLLSVPLLLDCYLLIKSKGLKPST
jgi:hypothetical protein